MPSMASFRQVLKICWWKGCELQSMANDWTINRTSGPSQLPITVAEAKAKLNLSAADDTHDAEIQRAITAATEQVEQDTGIAAITQTFVEYRNEFCGDAIQLHRRPVQSITSVTYANDDGTQTLATSVYGFDQPRRQVYLKSGQTWPSTIDEQNAVAVTFVAGFGLVADNVPRLIQEAILLQVGAWFYDPAMEMPGRDAWSNAYERIICRLMGGNYP